MAVRQSTIARAAAVVMGGFLASGVLGLARSAAFSAVFGASEALTAFYAAQRIPETLFVLVAGGALGSSFIPVFARFLAKDDEAGAWRLASAVMTCAAIAAALLAIVIAIFAPQIIPIFVPDTPPVYQALTVELTRAMLITVVIFSVSGLLMGLLNARRLFALPALAMSANNLGQIAGALIFAQIIPGTLAEKTYGLAFGAVVGALLHLGVQLPGLRRAGARLRFLPNPRTPGASEVLALMIPRVIGLGVVQVNFSVNLALTSGMAAGSYVVLTQAWQLVFFALGLIGQSIGTAAFPALASMAAANDLDGYKARLAEAMRGVLFLALPATIGLILLGGPLVALLFERGAWTPEDTAATAWALGFFALGIAGHGLLEILARAFYALEDTRTPVIVGVASIVVNIALSLLLIRVIGSPDDLSRGAFGGLALANSLATLGEALVLWALLRRRLGALHDRRVLDGAARALAASLIMGVLVAGTAALLETVGVVAVVLAGGAIGVGSYFGVALLLRLDEARSIPRLLLRR